MEYTIDKLDEAIVFYLTINSNVPHSLSSIFQGLKDEKIIKLRDTDIPTFMTTCYYLNKNYDNILKEYHNGIVYLTFSTYKRQFKDDEYVNRKADVNIPDDGCQLISYLLENKK